MRRQLVLVHGRAQEQKDSIALKAEWLEALEEGLAKSNLTLPIPETDVRFPFYGDTLYEMVGGKSADQAAEIVVRGEDSDEDETRFTRAILEEVRQKAGITDAQLAEVASQEVVDRGPLNWEWSQSILKAIDRFVPHGSGTSIALFTKDVYQYLKNQGIRDTIDTGVSAAMTPGVETVVVAHSLGTVVAYNLLRQQGHLQGWKVPLLVTVGSPLAVGEIRKTLRKFAPTRCPECVSRWFNAMDERDVVALYPLDSGRFPLDPANPAIENKRDVRNKTRNRHGIAGYLDDKEVAKRIHDALTA
ncbi:MAG TPA: alpha/beta hydrolase [Thermoanaerobaculia bacterium]|nr:alpha/beta hydrolase [Thermoanaerobaculia bacterium]